MSNKGTYKRAVKDLAAMLNVNIELEENKAQMQFADGTAVTFTGDIRTYSCTCGARTICKHIIIALLAAKELYEGQEQTKTDFSSFLNMNVRGMVSEKIWEEIMFREQFRPKVVLEEEAVLVVSFPEENMTIRFLTAESVDAAICTCKADRICRHKAEAVYVYQKEKGVLHHIEEARPLIIATENLSIFKEGIERIVHRGLSRLPENTVHEMEQLSVKARTLRMVKLENLFRKLATDVRLYRTKHTAFRTASYRETLSSIYEHLLLVERRRVHEGAYRSEYYEVPPITLYAFGASGWQTKSGYVGITYYFYYPDQGKWMTYTQSRPVFYEGSSVTSEQLHEKQAPWGMEGTGFELSRSVILLRQAKLSTKFQLSSSSHTIGEVEGKTNVTEWHSFFLNSWEELLGKVKRHGASPFCIEIAEIGEWMFQQQEQKWILPLIDKMGKILQMQVIKRPENERIIRLIKMYMDSSRTKRMLVHTYEEKGKLVVTPVVLYTETGEILNITLNEGGTIYDRDWARY